jgi:AcrR family transcriptional regulator
MAEGTPQAVDAPSLQNARKAFTRTHICNAARELFYRQGYAATTFEHVAKAAGTRRTTLYSHFRDKAEILEAIGDEYHEGLCRLAEDLPGPTPSRSQIDAWIVKLVEYVVRERAPATLLISLGISEDKPTQVEKWSNSFLRALAVRLPAFRRAVEPGAENLLATAWARVVLRELSLGCLEAARTHGTESVILDVIADLFGRFVRENA